MRLFLCLSFLLSNLALADAGKILKISDTKKAYLTRGKEKLPLSQGMVVQMGDKISSENGMVLVQIYPGSQLGLLNKTEVTISDFQITQSNETKRAYSLIDLHQGTVRGLVGADQNLEVEQKINTEGASLAISNGEFEATLKKTGDVDLNVVQGEVLVSSPFIQSFVPEIVKSKQGLSFMRKKKAFAKKRFSPLFKKHPKFEDTKALLESWKKEKP